MSDDASFDMIRAGKKVRCLTVPFNLDNRELGIRTVEDLTRTIADASHRLDLLERDQRGQTVSYATETGSTTLQDLFDQQHFSRGSADPVKKTEWNPKPDVYFCEVNRVKGTVGDDR